MNSIKKKLTKINIFTTKTFLFFSFVLFEYRLSKRSAVEFVQIVDHEHQALELHLDGMHTTRCAIHAISKGIKDSHVQYVKELIERLLIEKWSNAVCAINLFIVIAIQKQVYQHIMRKRSQIPSMNTHAHHVKP